MGRLQAILNEGSARRLHNPSGNDFRCPVCVRCSAHYSGTASQNVFTFFGTRHGFTRRTCLVRTRARCFLCVRDARECAYACVSAREAERVVREASGVCLRSIALGGDFAGGDCSGSTEVRWVEGFDACLGGKRLARGGLSARELYQIRSSTYAHTPSALEPPSTHRLRAPSAADTTAAPTEDPFVPDQV